MLVFWMNKVMNERQRGLQGVGGTSSTWVLCFWLKNSRYSKHTFHIKDSLFCFPWDRFISVNITSSSGFHIIWHSSRCLVHSKKWTSTVVCMHSSSYNWSWGRKTAISGQSGNLGRPCLKIKTKWAVGCGVVVHAYNANIQEVEAGGSLLQAWSHFWAT